MKMTMRIRMIIATLMLMVSMGGDAQIKVGYQTDSAKIAEYRERIGIDTKDVKQADLAIHFSGGVSESHSTNELFSYMSRYVQAHEKLNQ